MNINTIFEANEINTIDIYTYLDKFGLGSSYIAPHGVLPSDPKIYPNVNLAINYIKDLLFLYRTDMVLSTKIYIVQDSDVDGILSAALMYKFLTYIGISEQYIKVLFHNHKTHGLTDGIIERIGDDCSHLIIPDAGTNDSFACQMLFSKHNIRTLVIDHHLPTETNKYAIIVNNQLNLDNLDNINRELCGTGVVFKVISAFFNPKIWEIDEPYFGDDKTYNDWIDLVAVANIADMQSLLSYEVRMFNFYSFEMFGVNNPFLEYLCRKEIGHTYPTPHDISFKISPLLNAVCRLVDNQETKELLFKAFVAEDDYDMQLFDKAYEACIEAREFQRKEVEKIIRQAKKMLIETPNCILAQIPMTPYTGLVAAKLMEEYKRITFVVHEGDNMIFGSARSPVPFNHRLQECGRMVINKGHEQAWGMGWHKADTDYILEWVNKQHIDFIPEESVIWSFKGDSIPFRLFGIFDDYDYLWGKNLPEPKFHIVIPKVHIDTLNIKIMGKKKNTVSFMYDDIKYIWFGTSKAKREMLLEHNGEITLEIIGKLTLNNFKGKVTRQVIINRLEICQNEITPRIKITDWADIFK